MNLKDMISNYSGLFAILVYTLLFILFSFIRKAFKHETVNDVERKPLDVNDEYALVASLMASILHREKTHKNVKVISVREVR